MATQTLKRSVLRWLPIVITGCLLLASLWLLYEATKNVSESGRYEKLLLYLNALILGILVVAILVNIIRVLYQWHMKQAGSRFIIRLMSGFLILTLLPVVIVSVFSLNFVGKNVREQYDQRIEIALDDAIELSRVSLEVRGRTHLNNLYALAQELQEKTHLEILDLLDRWRVGSNANEVVLTDKTGQIIASSHNSVGKLLPRFHLNELIRQLVLRDDLIQIETVGDNEQVFTRVAVRTAYGNTEEGILTALLSFSEREQSLVRSVIETQTEYKAFAFNRELLRSAFRIALMVIAVLTVLFAFWAAFTFSKRLTRPVRGLVDGTLAVASGDLRTKIPVSEKDDFSMLARSFNIMTDRLASVQKSREEAQKELQQEHDYLDVVLDHLSSGVITMDGKMVVRRINNAALKILDVPADRLLNTPLPKHVRVAKIHTSGALNSFLSNLEVWLADPSQEWASEIKLDREGGRQILVCRAANLPSDDSGNRGHVLVFEDVTELVQAEHDAAWGEVAQRMAHEIKNPLTPIQLSAERLQHKLDPILAEEQQNFLARMTQTITTQVDGLKSMVDAFSEYAKSPKMQWQQGDPNTVLRDMSALYSANSDNVEIKLELGDLPNCNFDPKRLNQLFVNLVKNALEALNGHKNPTIWLKSSLNDQFIQLEVADNGPGIDPELLPRIFEPYVTNKTKGTGLGMAVVAKIVEEHGGQIQALNTDIGASIIVNLPIQARNQAEAKNES